jgi:pectin methylesterase-like acyl-CoA thioesterase
VTERILTIAETARARWLGCLCCCCLSACGSADQNPSTAGVGNTGAFGTGGSAAATGGARASSTGGSSQLGGAASGGATTNGGTSVSIGGSIGQGGASSGVAPAGGVSTGGAHSGATSSGGLGAGGNANGGKATGGNGVGGTAAGGKAAAGASTGGVATGGSSAGGTATGGKAAAGASAGGVGTGGKATAGAASGGVATAGSGDGNDLCPAGITRTIAVAKDASGQYSTLQAALDSITKGSSTPIRINVKAGTYKEKITIADRTNLCLVGDAATTTILTFGDSNSSVGSTSGSASVLISANDFSAAQLTIENSYGSGSQAVALRTTGQRQQFLDCRFVGYQDTLYVHSGTQYFRNCYVQGNTDYVFGGATAILQNCEVRNVEKGSAVAAPNTASSTAYGIVFLGGQFSAVAGISGVALARPWGADGAAAFLNATLGAHISANGFTSMSGNDPANARFSEYQSTGAGANASSRSSYQMTAAQAANYTIAKIYGGAWTPSYSL